MRQNRLIKGIAATLLVCLLSSGCSSKARPLSLAFGGLSFAPTTAGLTELLIKLPDLPSNDAKGQLRAFCDSSAETSLKQKSAYVLARLLQHGGNAAEIKEAIDRFEQAAGLKPLWERCNWHVAECGQAIGDEKIAREALEKIGNKSTLKHSRVAALYSLGQSYMRTGDREKAAQIFNQVATAAPESQFALGSTYYLAELETARAAESQQPAGTATAAKDGLMPMSETHAPGTDSNNSLIALSPPAGAQLAPPQAMAAFRHYLDASPDGRFATEIISQLNHMQGFQPSEEDHDRFARVFYKQGLYADALSEWRKVNNKSEWFKQALCLIKTGKTTEGKKALQEGISSHPKDASVEAAATLLCRYLTKDGAIEVWKGVLEHSPQLADVAMFNLATRAPSLNEGLPYFRTVFNNHPNSANAADAGWWCAWADIQAGNSKQAIAELQAVSTRYPDAKATPRCLFWTGKMYEQIGQNQLAKNAYATAVKLHKRSYYGHRAEARLSALSGGTDRGWSINPSRKVAWARDTADDWSFPEPPQELAKQEGPTVEVLTELRQWDECLELLKHKTGVLRAFYLAKLGMTLNAINSAYSALGPIPQRTEAWQLAYPLLYAKVIATEASTKKLDPFLVQALIREESRYNTKAVSCTNAIGLMQLMPATAYGVAKRLGIHLGCTDDIHKPENNLRMGIDYLGYTIKRFKGSALYAVASYNGGPNAVAKWSTKWPGDPDVFVENIPFTETRDYVRKVFGSYWNYEAIYAKTQQKSA